MPLIQINPFCSLAQISRNKNILFKVFMFRKLLKVKYKTLEIHVNFFFNSVLYTKIKILVLFIELKILLLITQKIIQFNFLSSLTSLHFTLRINS